MKITVFTSNQPRHLSLIKKLSTVADELYAIIEVNTIFPGKTTDFFSKSEIMQQYFSKVIDAEKEIFGNVEFIPKNCDVLILKSGDLNLLNHEILKKTFDSDLFIIFGSSYIKGDLCEHLVQNKAINIHMGVSPYYRGSSCNFWALYDKKPEMVGATIHSLSKGLDSGDMLFHVIPKPEPIDPFLLGMKSVLGAQNALISKISNNEILKIIPIKQQKDLEVRYTRNMDFTDKVAKEYLERKVSVEEIFQKMKNRNLELFTNPIIN